jgi:hypothetical protein
MYWSQITLNSWYEVITWISLNHVAFNDECFSCLGSQAWCKFLVYINLLVLIKLVKSSSFSMLKKATIKMKHAPHVGLPRILHIIGHTHFTNVGFQTFAKCYAFNKRLLNSTTNYFWQDQLLFIKCVKALPKMWKIITTWSCFHWPLFWIEGHLDVFASIVRLWYLSKCI